MAAACDSAAAPQPNAGLADEAGDLGCPAGMARVDIFCVDRYEAALVVVATSQPWSRYWSPGTTGVRAVSLRNAVPQYIDGTQAGAACAAAGKRLCTDAEWLRACQGPGATTYPYGDTYVPGACNDLRAVHPAVELFGTTDLWIFGFLDHPCPNQLPGSLEKTRAGTACVTGRGPLRHGRKPRRVDRRSGGDHPRHQLLGRRLGHPSLPSQGRCVPRLTAWRAAPAPRA